MVCFRDPGLRVQVLTLYRVVPLIVAVAFFGCAEVQTAGAPQDGGAPDSGTPNPMLCAGVLCDDENNCTGDVCNPVDGECLNLGVDDGTICDFGGVPGQCAASVCEDAARCNDAAVRCDDEIECTEDLCIPANGQCSNEPVDNGLPCDFGGGPGVCTDGACEDAMRCSDASTRCNDDESCTTDTCDPDDGMCSNDPRTGTCKSQLDSLTVLGDCMGGACVQRFCDESAQCGDNNECTSDRCDQFTNRCINTNVFNGTSCRAGTGTCFNGFCLFLLPPPIPPPILLP